MTYEEECVRAKGVDEDEDGGECAKLEEADENGDDYSARVSV